MSERIVNVSDLESDRMRAANDMARASFKFFWRELSWENRRIIPGLGHAIVKLAFANHDAAEGAPSFEHMWIGDIGFDGDTVSGTLLNQPEWITSIQPGDPVSVPFAEIGDWMYSIHGRAYGGYTIDVIRADMSKQALREHDSAWGLTFGPPGEVAAVPSPDKKASGLLSGLFAKKNPVPTIEALALREHPMCENMADRIEESLRNSALLPDLPTNADGWTMMHIEALAGNYLSVALMLRYGADAKGQNNKGQRAIDLARKIGWPRIVELLEDHS